MPDGNKRHILIDPNLAAGPTIADAISSTTLVTPLIDDARQFQGLVNDQTLGGVLISADNVLSGPAPIIGMAAASEIPVFAVAPQEHYGQVALALARAGVDDFLVLPVDNEQAGVMAALASLKGELEGIANADQFTSLVAAAQHAMAQAINPGLPQGYQLKVHQTAGGGDITGDCWGARTLDDGRIVLWAADFPGAGIEPGMLTLRLYALMAGLPIMPDRPEDVLAWLNHRFVRLLPDGQGVPMIYAVIDNQFDNCVFAASGFPGPMVLSADGELVSTGEGKGLPLGMSPSASYPVQQITVARSHTLLLHSDGLLTVFDDAASADGAAAVVSGVIGAAIKEGLSPVQPIKARTEAPPSSQSADVTALCLTMV